MHPLDAYTMGMELPVKRCVRVLDGGLLSSVQDLGRSGVGWLGVSPAGAADTVSARLANQLVGNDEDCALIETTMTGIALEFSGPACVAVTGADALLSLDGVQVRAWRTHALRSGQRLALGRATLGLRNYVAVDGGMDTPLVMGSRSTDIVSAFGGYQGRRLKAGDVLALRSPIHGPFSSPRHATAARPPAGAGAASLAAYREELLNRPAILRVLPGPHAAPAATGLIDDLCRGVYRASVHSSRQALRLEGDPINTKGLTGLLSSGTCAGCIQLTGSGQLLILLAEHQTTGGYAVMLCVIGADIPRAAQVAPGDEVRFVRTTYAQAAKAAIASRQRLRQVRD